MNNAELKILAKIINAHKFPMENVLTLGVAGIEIQTERQLLSFMHDLNIPIISPLPPPEYNSITKLGKTIHQNYFLKVLGAKNIDAIDINPNEGCNLTFDLGEPLPEKIFNGWDLIIDGGTTEHIFNISTAFKNYINLLKINGSIIHMNPISGSILHGYYQISPKLYFDFYRNNGCEILECKIVVHQPQGNAYYFNYLENDFLPSDFRGDYAYIFIVAKKISNNINSIYYQNNSIQQLQEFNPIFKNLIKVLLKKYAPKTAEKIIPLIKKRIELYRISGIKKEKIR